MKNYIALIEYDGTNYYGWQKQPDVITLQETIEKVLSGYFNEKIEINASGRTDRGVHAIGQVISFKANNKIPGNRLKYALNSKLPNDIVIVDSSEVDEDFHARYNAIGKTYIYKMYISDSRRPIYENRYGQCLRAVDIEKMREAAKYLIGKHDFNSFKSSNTSIKTTVRTLYSIDIKIDKNIIEIEYFGNGFLYNMVRIITGTLIDIGQGKYEPEYIKEILEYKDRTKAGPTAPAGGLYLKEVHYKQKYFKTLQK